MAGTEGEKGVVSETGALNFGLPVNSEGLITDPLNGLQATGAKYGYSWERKRSVEE